MPTLRLTQQAVAEATYEGRNNSAHYLNDELVPGLAARIYPSGRKSYVIRYRTAEKRQRVLSLGDCSVLKLGDARALAREKLVDVLKGADPQAQKRAAATAKTMGDLCDLYIERHARPRKKTWRQDEKRLGRNVRTQWANRTVVGITSQDVADLHFAIGTAAPYEANRTLEILRKMFNLAPRWGVVPSGWENPATGIERFDEKKRERWVTHEELPRLAQAIDAEDSVYVRAAFWLLLLTGSRKSELLRTRWEDVSIERRQIRVPETKNGRAHTLHLSDEAVAIVREIPRIEGNLHVFVGRREGAHLVNVDKAWRRVRERAGIPDVRLHDLRRTVGSWLAQSGNSLLLIQKALNHKSHAATLVYTRFGDDPVRRAIDEHGQQISRALSGDGGEVVDLDRVRRGGA